MKKLVALLLACMLILAAAAAMAEPSGTVMLYSSLKEKQLVAVKEAFEAKYPGIVMDYYQAGTGKIKTKIATEQQAGQVAADLLWVGDASDYLTFKEQGILEAYVSPESEKVPAAYKDEDDLYCGARLVVMGMAYNTQNVTEEEAPKHWKDLLNETFRDQIIMTDPTESGTTAYLVGALVNNEAYGWAFFEDLAAMHAQQRRLRRLQGLHRRGLRHPDAGKSGLSDQVCLPGRGYHRHFQPDRAGQGLRKPRQRQTAV